MVKHYFQTPNPDLSAIQKRLVFWFKEHEYEVDSTDADGEVLIQARKTGKLRTFTGTNIAFKIRLFQSDEPNEFVFESTTGQWTQNLAGVGVSAIFTGGLTLLTGAAGAAWAMKVERDIVEYMENNLRFVKTKTIPDKETVSPASLDGDAVPVSMPPLKQASSPREKALAKVAADQKKLEDAHAAGILDDDEFAKKKQALDAKVGDYEVQFAVEEKAVKLKAALDDGILDQDAYQSKLAALEASVRIAIEQERKDRENSQRLAKLRSALENGVLSQEEYDAKVAELQ